MAKSGEISYTQGLKAYNDLRPMQETLNTARARIEGLKQALDFEERNAKHLSGTVSGLRQRLRELEYVTSQVKLRLATATELLQSWYNTADTMCGGLEDKTAAFLNPETEGEEKK